MIFVMVGMHSLGFPRLVQAMDRLAPELEEDVVMQVGSTHYAPVHCRVFDFAPEDQIDRWCADSRVIVSHAGAGSILTAQKARKPLILVPRLRQYGEHIDDHQLELATVLHETGRALLVTDVGNLSLALGQAPALKSATHSGRDQLIAEVKVALTRGIHDRPVVLPESS